MHINELNFYQNTFEEHREDDQTYESAFPLFNIAALRDSQIDMPNFTYLTADKVAEMVDEITTKKSKQNNGSEVVIKTRGRKAVPKNGKSWDDPTITMKEIIENDLAGEPTANDIKSKEERLRKMREAKAKKRAQRLSGNDTETSGNSSRDEKNSKIVEVSKKEEVKNGPQIVFRDGKVVIETAIEEKKLVLEEVTKPKKLTSMSFRTKNHTSKWTEEETKKFYKAIEIFGADFSMIAKLFQTRNRDQIKNKYNKESKVNGQLVDEAFKKNSVLCKRSIMERIKLFNNNLTKLTEGNGYENLEVAAIGLERNASNNSTDSLDLQVLGEIQDVFVKEIKSEKEKNSVMNPFGILNGTTFTFEQNVLNKINDDVVEFSNNNVVNTNDVTNNNNNNVMVEEAKVQTAAVSQQKNLLLKLLG